MTQLSFMVLTLLVSAAAPEPGLPEPAKAELSELPEPAEMPEPTELPELLSLHESTPVEMSPERLSAALRWARQKVAGYRALERTRPDRGAASSHYRRYGSADPETQRQGREALAWVEAARAPANLSAWTGAVRLDDCPTVAAPCCQFWTRFRRQDGACNNFFFRLWGASDTPMARLRENTFDDGLNVPRSLGQLGDELASARKISANVTGCDDVADTQLTLSFVDWGQFMDHDITLAPVFLAEPGVALECCQNGMIAADAHPQCLPIEIPADDPFYAPLGQQCMEFTRSIPAMPSGCWPGPTITQNVLTAFIDGSGVYGSRLSRTNLVRAGFDGQLTTQEGNLLPPDPPGVQIDTENPCFSEDETAQPCFLAGDVRAMEQTGLTAMHTIWMREHNRLASGLATLNPHWDDERLFQEARRIVGAELQHITYNEWLPRLLGEDFMHQWQIETTPGSHYSIRYWPFINPTISTEFSTAAFRFGHTLVQGKLRLYEQLDSPPPAVSLAVNLRQVFFNPQLFYDGRLDQVAIGMVTSHPQTCDANFVEDITEFLFQEEPQFGLDLIALNIQRGRDHGIATYNTMRQACGLGRAAQFSDLEPDIPWHVVSRLKGVYQHVDDIDLFIGMVSERLAPGAVVGPTIQCIVGDQFARLRWGDNFFYDLGGVLRPWRFSLDQLFQLKKVSWARVLCDNIESISSIQRQAFSAPGDGNVITSCSDLPEMGLSSW